MLAARATLVRPGECKVGQGKGTAGRRQWWVRGGWVRVQLAACVPCSVPLSDPNPLTLVSAVQIWWMQICTLVMAGAFPRIKGINVPLPWDLPPTKFPIRMSIACAAALAQGNLGRIGLIGRINSFSVHIVEDTFSALYICVLHRSVRKNLTTSWVWIHIYWNLFKE